MGLETGLLCFRRDIVGGAEVKILMPGSPYSQRRLPWPLMLAAGRELRAATASQPLCLYVPQPKHLSPNALTMSAGNHSTGSSTSDVESGLSLYLSLGKVSGHCVACFQPYGTKP